MNANALDDADSVAQKPAAVIPAGRVRRDQALVFADRAAAGQLTAEHREGG